MAISVNNAPCEGGWRVLGMKILVMGAGAIGSVVGGFMAKAGHEVMLVGRDPHIGAIVQDGLRISGIWGDHVVSNLHAGTGSRGFGQRSFDLILITVKSYDTLDATRFVYPVVEAQTLVCAYQNGLGNAETIANLVGWERTVGARVIFGARINAPGHVEVTVMANPTALGVYHPSAPASRVRAIAETMNEAGIPTVFTEKIATLLWAKVAYNCALNPLSALLDVPYGVLAETDYTRSIMGEVIDELYQVGHAVNVELDPPEAEDYKRLLFDELIPPTAAHYASMREDLLLRRRTEIEAINGAIVRNGARHGIACPANAFLTRMIHAREHALGIPLE